MPTLRDYLLNIGDRLGGIERGTVSMDPDSSEQASQRRVISASLFDLDKQATAHQYKHLYVPRYDNQRTISKNGFGRLSKAKFTAPSSGSYTLTVWGFGTTSSLTGGALGSNAAAIQSALTGISGLEAVTVTGTYPDFLIDLVDDEYAIEASAGSIESGFGYTEVTRPFTKALRAGDEYLMLSMLPFYNQDNFTGVIPAINMALASLYFTDRIPFTVEFEGQQTWSLEDHPWLQTQDQVTSLFAPTQWELVVPFTPPGSSTYTLTVTTHEAVGTTAAIAYDASASTVQAALRAVAGLESAEVTGTSPLTITISDFWYYNPVLTASAGTVGTPEIRRQYPVRRSTAPYRVVLEGPKRYLDLDYSYALGHTIFLQVERPGNTKVCRQTDYETEGTTWTEGDNLKLEGYMDQSPLGVEEVGVVAYWRACQSMAKYGPGADRSFWAALSIDAGQAAAGIKLRDLPTDPNPKASASGAGQGTWGTKSWSGW